MKQILKYVILNLEEHLKFAESKHSITLTFAGAIVVFTTSFLSIKNMSILIFAVISIVFCGLSILFSFFSLMSRKIKVKDKRIKDINKESLLFFNDISNFRTEEYLLAIKEKYNLPKEYEPDGYDRDLAKYIIANSRVIKIKYMLFNRAISFLYIGVTSIVVCAVLVAVHG